MALPARNRGISRRCWLLAGMGIPLSRAWSAPVLSLSVSFDGDNLHIAAPDLHFIAGRVLSRVKDADTVTFFSQITLSDERGNVFKRLQERVVVSYALWEEKFAVTIPGAGARTTMHNTAAQAEAWAIENLAISALGVAPNRPFWLRFELRAATQRDMASVIGEYGISVRGVVDFFSRKSTADSPSWTVEKGPLRLADLPRTVFHGRNG
jgi:hypothetical protein